MTRALMPVQFFFPFVIWCYTYSIWLGIILNDDEGPMFIRNVDTQPLVQVKTRRLTWLFGKMTIRMSSPR